MITNKLWNELRDSGFPFGRMSNIHVGFELGIIDFDGEKYYMPTMESLMKELGEDFGYLSYPHKNDWRANSDGTHEDCEGKTAKEALIRLYILLHRKK